MPHDDVRPDMEVLFAADRIAARIDEVAGAVAALGLHEPLAVPILTGSFMFAADLLRALHRRGIAPEVDFLTLSSYRTGTRSQGHVEVLRDLEQDVADRDVLLIDDVLDSGRTLAFARDTLAARHARRVVTCVLLDKQAPRAAAIVPDIAVFQCPDFFVVGYGMDLAGRYRELPYVGRIRAG